MTVGAAIGKHITFNKVTSLVWEEFIYGGHLVALGPTVIAYICLRLSNYAIHWQLILGLYLITFIVHLLDRYIDINDDSSSARFDYFRRMKPLLPYILTASLLVLAYILRDNLAIAAFALFLVGIGVLYTLFFKKLTRYVVGFKSFYTAAVFASSAIFASFYDNWLVFTPVLTYVYIFFFLRWFSDTVFCDLKDVVEDRKNKLRTFANSMDKDSFYTLLSVINILSIFPIVIGIAKGYLPGYSILLLSAPLYSNYYIGLSRRKGADYQKLANVWADGESIVWMFAVLVGGLVWA